MTVTSAASRMQRLLSLVPWIAAQDGPTIAEVCSRFDLSAEELAADLEVIWLVGLPPYTPDALIDVVQEGDRVWIHYADVFSVPQRLTPDQAVALLTAGASVLAIPGADRDGALARGVAKLSQALGIDSDAVLDIELGLTSTELLGQLREAVAQRRRVHLDYYSSGRDERTERDVDPYVVHVEDGAVYLLGYCHRAGGERRFRVDRIASLALLGEHFDPPGAEVSAEVFQPAEADPRVTLELTADAAWVAEVYPTESVEPLAGGGLRVVLAVAGRAWFERLLVSLGPQVVVVDAPEALLQAGQRAAARILDRYL